MDILTWSFAVEAGFDNIDCQFTLHITECEIDDKWITAEALQGTALW